MSVSPYRGEPMGDELPPTADLQSPRLLLRPLDSHFLSLCLRANGEEAAGYLSSEELPDEWLGKWRLMALHLQELHRDPAYLRWSLRAILCRTSGAMVGHIGFHTPPNPDYLAQRGSDGIEIGYEIYPAWRRRGLGREALQTLLQFAHTQGVRHCLLSIATDNSASMALARSLGFEPFGPTFEDEEGGLCRYWRHSRPSESCRPMPMGQARDETLASG